MTKRSTSTNDDSFVIAEHLQTDRIDSFSSSDDESNANPIKSSLRLSESTQTGGNPYHTYTTLEESVIFRLAMRIWAALQWTIKRVLGVHTVHTNRTKDHSRAIALASTPFSLFGGLIGCFFQLFNLVIGCYAIVCAILIFVIERPGESCCVALKNKGYKRAFLYFIFGGPQMLSWYTFIGGALVVVSAGINGLISHENLDTTERETDNEKHIDEDVFERIAISQGIELKVEKDESDDSEANHEPVGEPKAKVKRGRGLFKLR